jgi:hypothetical protein
MWDLGITWRPSFVAVPEMDVAQLPNATNILFGRPKAAPN